MFCPKCGNEIEEEYEFCMKCGNKIETKGKLNNEQDGVIVEKAEGTNAKKKNKKKIILITAISVLIIALGLCIYFVFFNGHDFRNADWGMTLEEVKKSETAEIFGSGEGYISYIAKDFKINEKDEKAALTYKFKNNSLKSASVLLYGDEYSLNDVLSIYEKKYGKYTHTTIDGSDVYIWKTHRFNIMIGGSSELTRIYYSDPREKLLDN